MTLLLLSFRLVSRQAATAAQNPGMDTGRKDQDMAGSPRFKVFHFGNYVAACGDGAIAAAVASMTSEGVVKVEGRIVWREGKEDFPAGDSYDAAGDIMRERARQHHAERLARYR